MIHCVSSRGGDAEIYRQIYSTARAISSNVFPSDNPFHEQHQRVRAMRRIMGDGRERGKTTPRDQPHPFGS